MIKTKQRYIIPILIITGVILVVVGATSFFAGLNPTYVDTIKSNWGVSLPEPDHETTIMDTRGGFQGDGDAITELQYSNQADLKKVEMLSSDWVDGNTFANEGKKFTNLIQNDIIQNLINHVNPQAKYFYLEKYGSDYIVFELKGHELTIYESYV